MQAEIQQLVVALPKHLLACVMGSWSAFSTSHHWAADLTDAKLSCSGPLEHVARGAQLLTSLLQLLPRYR